MITVEWTDDSDHRLTRTGTLLSFVYGPNHVYAMVAAKEKWVNPTTRQAPVRVYKVHYEKLVVRGTAIGLLPDAPT